MKVKVGFSMKNKYTIRLEKDGKSRVVAKFTNVVLDQFVDWFGGGSSLNIYAVVFGTGSSVPSSSQTNLDSILWGQISYNYSNIDSWKKPYSTDTSWHMKFTAKIPASESYVGTVSELGITVRNGNSMMLMTRALIKDAESNPITITKQSNEVLYVDVHLEFVLNDSNGLTWNRYFIDKKAKDSSLPTFRSPYSSTSGINFRMLAVPPRGGCNGARVGSSIIPSAFYNSSEKIRVYSSGRFLDSNCTDQRYIHALSMCLGEVPVAFLEFPNESVFPKKTLSRMDVGVGDGETTDFIPPLNFWVPDTEVIYVDGVAKVRGTDYTCDSSNNLSELPELFASSLSKILTPFIESEDPLASYNYQPPGDPLHDGSIMADDSYFYGPIYKWDKDTPLVWEMPINSTLDIGADRFVAKNLVAKKNLLSSQPVVSSKTNHLVFVLSYSSDNSTWQEAGRYEVTSNISSISFTIEFEERIYSRYWKLEVDISSCDSEMALCIFGSSYYYYNGPENLGQKCYLRRDGEPIHFVTPPENGAIITMDAQIDRPMKNDKFLIDFNPVLQF